MKKTEQVRKRFTKEIKQGTVKMTTIKGHSIVEIAKNLDVGYSILCR